MDILITFEDGTTELRDDKSPLLVRRRVRAATVELSARRGGRGWVWRITGGLGKGEVLTGVWVSCRVESVDEQIERLTRERDAARPVGKICDAGHADTLRVLRDTVAERNAQRARADDAERRLAGLRAWAEAEIAKWGVSCGCMGKAVARIDGKEDT